MVSALKCPNCGAVNPANAENCNLCFYRFAGSLAKPGAARTKKTAGAEGPTRASAEYDALEEAAAELSQAETGATTEPAEKRLLGPAPERLLRDETTRKTALAGGAAAVSGAWLILASFSVLHFLNIRAYDFLFTFMSVDRGKLSLYIVLLSLFGMLVGGIAGNVKDKRAIVPAARGLAAAIGLSVWAGLLQLIATPSLRLTDWLSQGWLGALATLAAFPLAAAAIGACESFGEDWSGPRALAGAIGGLAAGLLAAIVIANTYFITSVFGTDVPAGFWPVTLFGAKLMLFTGVFSFVAGGLLWFAIIIAEKVTGE